jgi:uncharacterized protein with WD repeat
LRTQIPDDDLEKIIENIHAHFKPASDKPAALPEESEASGGQASERVLQSAVTSAVVTDGLDDRKLRTLRKKLDQIELLKERQKKGEKLEANQVS